MMGGASSRRKGNRRERELVKLLDGAEIRGRVLTARRVPLSGAMKDTGFGGDLLVGEKCQWCQGDGLLIFDFRPNIRCEECNGTGTVPGSEERLEVKARAQGFRRIYQWLQDAHAVAFRGDREEWVLCIRLDDLVEK